MAKLIAFIGSPSSGKTTLALKTAMAAYMDKRTKNSRIVFLSPDINVPSVAVLFPNYVPDEICSLGAILDNTDISADMILKNIVTVKTMKDFGCLGFKSGESKFSYPTPTDDKISDLFNALSEIADYIFVDCTDRTDDKISKRALTSADIVFRVMSADPKGITWYSSNKNMGRIENEDIFNIVTVLDKDVFTATEEVCSSIHSVLAIVPYSKGIRQQMIDGRLYDHLSDKAYDKKIKTIISKILISEELE